MRSRVNEQLRTGCCTISYRWNNNTTKKIKKKCKKKQHKTLLSVFPESVEDRRFCPVSHYIPYMKTKKKKEKKTQHPSQDSWTHLLCEYSASYKKGWIINNVAYGNPSIEPFHQFPYSHTKNYVVFRKQRIKKKEKCNTQHTVCNFRRWFSTVSFWSYPTLSDYSYEISISLPFLRPCTHIYILTKGNILQKKKISE